MKFFKPLGALLAIGLFLGIGAAFATPTFAADLDGYYTAPAVSAPTDQLECVKVDPLVLLFNRHLTYHGKCSTPAPIFAHPSGGSGKPHAKTPCEPPPCEQPPCEKPPCHEKPPCDDPCQHPCDDNGDPPSPPPPPQP